ncbi:hypothetical protein TRIATDRAFT_173849, partial [Trichoderma atroviride IMI 206040]
RNEHFVCPEDLFGRITKQASETASCVTLTGLGGIGKSQLALEFAHRTAAEWPETWAFWVYAETLEDVEEGFRRIAEYIKLPAQNLPWGDLYQLVCDWLYDEQNGPWILILDGADDPSVLYKISEITNVLKFKRRPLTSLYLLKSLRPNSSIIVTTRNKDLAIAINRDQKNIIEVGPMPVVEATSLFRKIAGPKFRPALDMNAAIRLVKGLGLIPLAITQAALYIDKYLPKSITLVKYLEELEENTMEKFRLLQFDANSIGVGRNSTSILDTLQTSFDFVRSQRPSAANLLSLMSFFDRRGIPKWLLVSDIRGSNTPRANSPSIMGRLELDDNDGDTNNDSTDTFDGDIDILMNHYLIGANRTRDIFEMHGLVQLAAQKSLSDAEERAYCDQFIHRLAAEFPSSPLGNWSTCQELFAHVQTAAQYPPSVDASEDWATLLYNGGRYARLLGDYETAKQMSDRVSNVRQVMEKEGGQRGGDMRRLENSSLTALILMDQGVYDEAERLFAQVTDAFKIMEAKLGEGHPQTLTNMSNLASMYRIRGALQKAEELQVKAMNVRDIKFGREHPDTLTSMNGLASIFRAQNRLWEAEELQVQVVELRGTKLGPNHP